jgi:hypothetical protein
MHAATRSQLDDFQNELRGQTERIIRAASPEPAAIDSARGGRGCLLAAPAAQPPPSGRQPPLLHEAPSERPSLPATPAATQRSPSPVMGYAAPSLAAPAAVPGYLPSTLPSTIGTTVYPSPQPPAPASYGGSGLGLRGARVSGLSGSGAAPPASLPAGVYTAVGGMLVPDTGASSMGLGMDLGMDDMFRWGGAGRPVGMPGMPGQAQVQIALLAAAGLADAAPGRDLRRLAGMPQR